MKKENNFEIGTIRILSKNLEPVIKTQTSWKKVNFDTTNIKTIIELFNSHNNFQTLIDTKNPKFLKGFLTPDKKVRGQRLNILPDNKNLDKAYSLFSPNLTIHDQSSNEHWDVIYQNPNGKFAYLYTLNKKQKAIRKKYQKVKNFEKNLPELEKNLKIALKKGELLALPMYTLLKTHMRVGNEIYYKKDGHKGLTTLKKHDIKIKTSQVTFNFIAKDGVPQNITKEFSEDYLKQLTKKIKPLKKQDFIFTNKSGKPLKDIDFEKAFEKYCGEKFYPHIVRSYYATKTVQDFIKQNKTPTEKQIKELYEKIATELGHKKFSKKKNNWQTSYTITIHHYIEPKLVEKLSLMIK